MSNNSNANHHSCNENPPGRGGPPLGPGGASEAPVVVTFTVTCAGLVPSGVTEAGETVHVAFDGAPVQASETAWLKPPSGISVSESLAEPPAVTVMLDGNPEATAREKSMPEPESETA